MSSVKSKVSFRAVMAIAAIIAILAVLPFFSSSSVIYMLGLAFIFVVYAVSWDVVAGYTGQTNLGHTVFIGIGAYTTALLQNSHRLGLDISAPIWLTIPAGGIAALLFGLGIGAVCLRLKGYYLALVTAILPLIFIQLANIYSGVFGGYEGFSVGFGKALASDVRLRYYIALAFMFISIAAMYVLVNSRIGVKLRAVRDDEELAEAVGIDVVKYKLLAFCVSAFFAGLAGAVTVHYRLTVGVDLFDIPLMLAIILGVIIGGIGTFYGAVFGGFAIYIAKNWIFRQIAETISPVFPVSDDILLYALLIVLILKAPEGITNKVKGFLSARTAEE
ncbi:branched-chain amino acid ABC transporter permease [Archaeoglobus veneficus]|uniref:ABC-type transporter, integral membrane subunit n=1 Tax=Archaeoglobus veneficus (strain DSM 11195 / SNP6) TaxID=693661 RepID=F2KRS2_ARCVS|nr:branched-chain amino acid ABC transporter permease [Archaeoglobus veneficus]AEA47936.1 ABC-type transporter, integral membrane subunit [Archaeoglobus veneficus SNP6]